MKEKRGFTLLEMIVTVAILFTLLSILVKLNRHMKPDSGARRGWSHYFSSLSSLFLLLAKSALRNYLH